jgi:hypothetical protein
VNLLRALAAAFRRFWVSQVQGRHRDEADGRRRARLKRLSNYQYAIRLTWRLKNLGRARAARERKS